MQFLNSEQTKAQLPLMLELDRRVFGAELIYSQTPEVHARIMSPLSLYASALSNDGKEMLAYLSVTITTDHYYRQLLEGKAKEEEFEPWKDKETPLLFIRNLVVKDRRATPYIFRSALKTLQATCLAHDIYIHRAFTIASHWTTRKALEAYQFDKVGLYQNKYPIMLASRDTSIVLNSFLKRYD